MLSRSASILSLMAIAMTPPPSPAREATTHVAAAEYRDFAHRELMRVFAPNTGHIEATVVGRHRDLDLPAGAVKLASRVPERIRSKATVWVDISVDGQVVRCVPVAFDVRWMRQALVARDHVAARTPLNEQRVELREIDVAGARGEPLVDVAQLRGKRLRRELSANAVIGRDDLEPLPPVSAGDRIDVYAKVRGVVVRTVGVAQRDGFEGDRINVRLDGQPTTLRVQVVGMNRATVIENANSQSF